MTDMEKRAAAKEFAASWKGRGDEKQETQAFWMSLLQRVYGVAEPDKFIEFEVPREAESHQLYRRSDQVHPRPD